VSAVCELGRNAAARIGSVECLEWLHEHDDTGVRISSVFCLDAAEASAEAGQFDTMVYILERSAEIARANADWPRRNDRVVLSDLGVTCTVAAAVHGGAALLRRLAEARDLTWSPFALLALIRRPAAGRVKNVPVPARDETDYETLEWMCQNGATALAEEFPTAASPMMPAATMGDLELARFLVRHGARWTCAIFEIALRSGHVAFVEGALAAGATLTAADERVLFANRYRFPPREREWIQKRHGGPVAPPPVRDLTHRGAPEDLVGGWLFDA
jgi:hypothetical protein